MSEPLVSRREIAATLTRCLVVVGVGMALYAALPYQSDYWWLAAIVSLVAVGGILPLTVRRLQRLRDSGRPVADAVEGIAELLAILVFGFSALYLVLDRNGGQFSGLETRVDAVYFTLSTISTVGFGDIHASGQAARVAVSIQILMGLLLIGVAARAFRVLAKQGLERTGRMPPGGDRRRET